MTTTIPQGLTIRFTVPGQPQGQRRARATTRNGHGHMYDDPRNQVYADLIRWAWRAEGATELGLEPFTVTVTAVFARPAGHWTSRGRLSAQGLRAGYYCTHRIDVDNIVKAVGDALNGLAWADDRQCVAVHAIKRWAKHDEPPHLQVSAQALREGLDWQNQP